MNQPPNDLDPSPVELMGPIPGWGLRWGISAVGLATFLLIGLAAMIRYPDVLVAEVVVSQGALPTAVLSPSAGKVVSCQVKQGQLVEKGEVLGLLDHTGDWQDITQLEEWLEQHAAEGTPTAPPFGLQMGVLQSSYSELERINNNYQQALNASDVQARLKALQEGAANTAALLPLLTAQIKAMEQEVQLAASSYQRNRDLLTRGGASLDDVERAESALLRQKRQLSALTSQRTRRQNDQRATLQQINILKEEQRTAAVDMALAWQQQLQTLSAEVDAWQQDYLLLAPIGGYVDLPAEPIIHQYFDAGAPVLFLAPLSSETNTAQATGYLDVEKAGKAEIGMEVHISLSAYPASEYGHLEGTLTHFSTTPMPDGYAITVSLPAPLTTHYQKELALTQQLAGQARIITEERSLLGRLLEGLWALWEG